VTILNAYLDSAGVDPQISNATRRFTYALDLYGQHRYRAACDEFLAVQKLNSHYPGIYTYIAGCQEKIKGGKGRAIGPVERIVIISVFFLLILGFLARRNIRRKLIVRKRHSA
jgi:hypothetical protein